MPFSYEFKGSKNTNTITLVDQNSIISPKNTFKKECRLEWGVLPNKLKARHSNFLPPKGLSSMDKSPKQEEH